MSKLCGRLAVFLACSVLWSQAVSAHTVYYVDPDYGGANGASDGNPAKPWTTLGSSQWTTINTALASGDVTVYFSAKEAGSATGESYGGGIVVTRIDSSSHRLTLDGMTYYNTNDANPCAATWIANPAPDTYKTKLVDSGAGYAIGWQSNVHGKQSNVTIRGFDMSGPWGRMIFAGDNLVVEKNYIHDITGAGDPSIGLAYACNASCTASRSSNVVIRDNVITNGYGESIYIGGCRTGFPACDIGNTNDHILIENNTITNAGIGGGEGEAIDLKDGLTYVTVRRNTIAGSTNGTAAIAMTGAYGGVNQNFVIEWNQISGAHNHGIYVGTGYGDPNGVTIRYNTITGSTACGIDLNGTPALDEFNITVLGNTIAKNTGGPGIDARGVSHLSVLNNLVFSNNASYPNIQFSIDAATRDSRTALSDYNLFCPGSSDANANAISGGHNVIRTDCVGLLVDPRNPGGGARPPLAPGPVIIR